MGNDPSCASSSYRPNNARSNSVQQDELSHKDEQIVDGEYNDGRSRTPQQHRNVQTQSSMGTRNMDSRNVHNQKEHMSEEILDDTRSNSNAYSVKSQPIATYDKQPVHPINYATNKAPTSHHQSQSHSQYHVGRASRSLQDYHQPKGGTIMHRKSEELPSSFTHESITHK